MEHQQPGLPQVELRGEFAATQVSAAGCALLLGTLMALRDMVSAGLGSAGLTVGLNDPKVFSKPKVSMVI